MFSVAGLAQDRETTLLPEIDPQDIEIRSQFQARFPGLMRQPILGFDPTPRLFRIDPDRMPFMENRDEVIAGVSMSDISRPDPPGYVPLRYADRINAFARAGFGTYTSPEAQFWGVYRVGDSSYLGADLDYASGDGHLAQMPAAFRKLQGNVEYGSKLNDRTRLDIYGGVRSDFNYSPSFTDVDRNQDIGRIDRTGFHTGASIRQMMNGVTGWDVRLNFRSFTAQRHLNLDDPMANEWVYDAGASYQWAGGAIQEIIRLKAGVRGGWYNFNGGEASHWNTINGSLIYDRLFNYATKVTAEAGAWYVSDPEADRIYPALHLKVRHWISDRVTLEGMADANVRFHSMEELGDRNRFLNPIQDLSHTYRIDSHAEVTYTFLEESTVYGGLGYERTLNRPVFRLQATSVGPTPFPNPDPPAYGVSFRDVNLLKMYAGLSHQLLPERLWFDGSAWVQYARLDDQPEGAPYDHVPYIEPWGVNTSISFKPLNRLKLEARADIVGPRHVSTASSSTMDTILLLGAQADVQITGRIGAWVRLDNLLNRNYEVWSGYRERPLQVFGGITLKL